MSRSANQINTTFFCITVKQNTYILEASTLLQTLETRAHEHEGKPFM